MSAIYCPEVFDACSLQEARQIILTDEEDHRNSDQRWSTETPYLLDHVAKHHRFTERSVVLDYGCGVGRLAKGLIERFNCAVIGADISANMRGLAASYVNHPKFISVHPESLRLFGDGFADIAICVWVLQHCPTPFIDLNRIWKALRFGRSLLVINEKGRRVPVRDLGWAEDKLDIREELAKQFELCSEGQLDPDVVGVGLSRRTFFSAYRKES